MSTIQVKNLTRTFQIFDKKPGLGASIKSIFYRPQRTVHAVENVSFEIKQGELVGFIGPNGAGKTTTLKCLSGLLYPSSGNISVLGFKPSDRKYEYLNQIGFVMGQKNQLWWDIPPQETFLLNKAIYNISDTDYQKRLDFFIKTLDIGDIISVQTKKLSLGQRMKCEFVAALLHNPKVLFLDEPTIGLDVIAAQKIRDFVKEINQQFKTTVILTSHNMNDVKELCKRVILIDQGRIKFDGLLSNLTKKFAELKILKFVFENKISKTDIKKFGEIVDGDGYSYTIKVSKEKYLSVASKILTTLPVTDLNIEDTPIENVIRQVYTDKN
ncbi:ABC transporter [Candidatus Shapirobacteria bacterium CG_4_9_14_3_um_filter_36_12]|uniref:ABC transporter n=1 Tax=Candidatus Shapirobacteria bacterium CG_4_9_14_3_um_filter_36_12 TaxID=1974877 RepID=A0A2M7XNB9_9BACT|nr:MAG: ABC transporter [Candidatus Shapirobacteria bacterium CG_4_9_14_3_um_filter_36_12]